MVLIKKISSQTKVYKNASNITSNMFNTYKKFCCTIYFILVTRSFVSNLLNFSKII